MGNAADSFGSMVFSSSVMRQRLPGDVYRALKRTVRGGHKLAQFFMASATAFAQLASSSAPSSIVFLSDA